MSQRPEGAPSHKTVMSLRRVRLVSTLKGHIEVIEPRKPTQIPWTLFEAAAQNGCVDYTPEMFEALQAAKTAPPTTPFSEPPEEGPGAEPLNVDQLLLNAVSQVLLASEDTADLLTNAGIPRVPAVRAAFEALLEGSGQAADVIITAPLIEDYFIRVRDGAERDAEPDPGADRYSDLGEGEVGDLNEDLLGTETSD